MTTVLLDVDGVLADFIGGILPIIHSVTDRLVTHDDIDQFDFCKALSLSDEHAAQIKKRIGTEHRIAASLPVCDGAKDGVRRLQEIADVYIVTSPWNSHETWTFDREAWLKKHFGILGGNVIHTSAKHLISGDFLVDDKTSTLVQWEAANPNGCAVQWMTPHNLDDEWNGLATNSWKALAGMIQRSRA